jgi:hypothetical protein
MLSTTRLVSFGMAASGQRYQSRRKPTGSEALEAVAGHVGFR